MSRKKAKKKDDWETLYDLIAAFEQAARADEMKGGGDPDAFDMIEAEFKLAQERLLFHIRYLRRMEE
jgi:hypothetical protein